MNVEHLIRTVAASFEDAELSYGHGTDNPLDEAAWLVFAVLQLSHDDTPAIYSASVDDEQVSAALALAGRRINERVPLAYLLNQAFFAGWEFFVDERVLVPRSPIAELINKQFTPWIEPNEVRFVVDLGTGSGCIAVAIAHAFPDARVDAVDISADALEVTAINIEKHGLEDRVTPVQSDFFSALGGRQYDLIVSNPPHYSANTGHADLPSPSRIGKHDEYNFHETFYHACDAFLKDGGETWLMENNSVTGVDTFLPLIEGNPNLEFIEEIPIVNPPWPDPKFYWIVTRRPDREA